MSRTRPGEPRGTAYSGTKCKDGATAVPRYPASSRRKRDARVVSASRPAPRPSRKPRLARRRARLGRSRHSLARRGRAGRRIRHRRPRRRRRAGLVAGHPASRPPRTLAGVRVDSIRPYTGILDTHRELELIDQVATATDDRLQVLVDGAPRVLRVGWATWSRPRPARDVPGGRQLGSPRDPCRRGPVDAAGEADGPRRRGRLGADGVEAT